MSVKWNNRQAGGVTVVDASGPITTGRGTIILRDTMQTLLAGGANHLILNLAEVAYMDSSGIGEMVSAFTGAKNQGGALKLLNVNKRIVDLLKMTHLDTIFQTFEGEAEAVASFGGAESN